MLKSNFSYGLFYETFQSDHSKRSNSLGVVEDGVISGKGTKKKRKRCGECVGCQRKDNCGDCAPCRNDKSHQVSLTGEGRV